MGITVGYDGNDDPLEMEVHTAIHLPRTLKFVSSEEDGYSTYTDTTAGTTVYLQHGTGKQLYTFNEMLQKFNLYDLWQKYTDTEQFLEMLRTCTIEPDEVDDWIGFCAHCGDPEHTDDLGYTNAYHGSVCDSCMEDFYHCSDCENYYRNTTTTYYESEVCEGCRGRNWHFCENCDGWRRDDDEDHYHEDDESDCDCESPQLHFEIRNDGDEPLANDTRTTLSLPAGIISAEGLTAIGSYLREFSATLTERDPDTGARTQPYHDYQQLSWRLEEIGEKWQAKDGSYTKRLSRFAYKAFGLKVHPEVVSQVGNIASAHSKGVEVRIETTRKFNMSAYDFYHGSSCWWQSYYEGRCALKSNGGFALRTFTESGSIAGRAWVMPLRLKDRQPTFELVDNTPGLTPTFETLAPDAFVIFNGYGDLDGYAGARIISHMAGMTYRKVEFNCYMNDYANEDMYVNSNAGYLVTTEEIAEHYTDGSLTLNVDKHSNLHYTETETRELVNA